MNVTINRVYKIKNYDNKKRQILLNIILFIIIKFNFIKDELLKLLEKLKAVRKKMFDD